MMFNFQIGEKVKTINRLMNRIMAALGPSQLGRSSISKPIEGEEDARDSGAAMSLLSFISICKAVRIISQGLKSRPLRFERDLSG